jgi:hypothetical protein
MDPVSAWDKSVESLPVGLCTILHGQCFHVFPCLVPCPHLLSRQIYKYYEKPQAELKVYSLSERLLFGGLFLPSRLQSSNEAPRENPYIAPALLSSNTTLLRLSVKLVQTASLQCLIGTIGSYDHTGKDPELSVATMRSMSLQTPLLDGLRMKWVVLSMQRALESFVGD